MVTVAERLVIAGRVQGIGYRAWTVDAAQRRNLRGWVRNRRDGTVEALLIGLPAEVEAMVAECHQGPRWAQVASVERHPAADDGSAGFASRPTV